MQVCNTPQSESFLAVLHLLLQIDPDSKCRYNSFLLTIVGKTSEY